MTFAQCDAVDEIEAVICHLFPGVRRRTPRDLIERNKNLVSLASVALPIGHQQKERLNCQESIHPQINQRTVYVV